VPPDDQAAWQEAPHGIPAIAMTSRNEQCQYRANADTPCNMGILCQGLAACTKQAAPLPRSEMHLSCHNIACGWPIQAMRLGSTAGLLHAMAAVTQHRAVMMIHPGKLVCNPTAHGTERAHQAHRRLTLGYHQHLLLWSHTRVVPWGIVKL